eukprot:277299-Amphidinium_carterae.1
MHRCNSQMYTALQNSCLEQMGHQLLTCAGTNFLSFVGSWRSSLRDFGQTRNHARCSVVSTLHPRLITTLEAQVGLYICCLLTASSTHCIDPFGSAVWTMQWLVLGNGLPWVANRPPIRSRKLLDSPSCKCFVCETGSAWNCHS